MADPKFIEKPGAAVRNDIHQVIDGIVLIEPIAERLGDDPAVLLRNYMKRKRSKQADKSLSDALATLATGFLGK
jgi:hypothetical protein